MNDRELVDKTIDRANLPNAFVEDDQKIMGEHLQRVAVVYGRTKLDPTQRGRVVQMRLLVGTEASLLANLVVESHTESVD